MLSIKCHLFWSDYSCSKFKACHKESVKQSRHNGQDHVDGLVQDCSISIANTLEILQSCTKSSMYFWVQQWLSTHQRGVSLTFHETLENILLKFVYCRSHTSYENFKLKLCMCAHALGTRKKFWVEILAINVISATVYIREIILKSSRNASETTPSILCRQKLDGSMSITTPFLLTHCGLTSDAT